LKYLFNSTYLCRIGSFYIVGVEGNLSLQEQYTFSIREYTHKEKVFDSRVQAKQFACSPDNK